MKGQVEVGCHRAPHLPTQHRAQPGRVSAADEEPVAHGRTHMTAQGSRYQREDGRLGSRM